MSLVTLDGLSTPPGGDLLEEDHLGHRISQGDLENVEYFIVFYSVKNHKSTSKK